jgi:para-nitrobenzyl esterase
LTSAEAAGQEFVKALGISESDPIAALRAANVDTLQSMSTAQGFSPVRDGWVVTAQGALGSRGVPLIVGAAANEFANLALLFPQSLPKDVKAYRSLLEKVDARREDRLLKMYPANSDERVAGAAIGFLTDSEYVCPSSRVAAKGSGRTWLYLFSAMPSPTAEGKRLGSFHGSDMRLIFNLEFGVPVGDAGRSVGEAMRRYWVRFAATGDPNKEGLPEWPAYDAKQRRYLNIGDSIRTVSGSVRESCDVFDEALSEQAPALPAH